VVPVVEFLASAMQPHIENAMNQKNAIKDNSTKIVTRPDRIMAHIDG
jgi:hypothetical protein